MATATRLSPWQVQKRVLHALFIREMKTRFGRWRLGYFWIFLEPIPHIAVFITLAEFGLRGAPAHLDFPMFLLTGLVPFQFFRRTMSTAMKAVNSNAGLLNYTRVKPMDTIVMRVILEIFVTVLVFCLLLFVFGMYLGTDVRIQHIPAFILTFLMLAAFSFGIGVIFCIIGTYSREFQKLVPLSTRPLFFISGVFFTLSRIPEEARPYLLWNPLLHFLEALRTFTFHSYQSPIESWTYPAMTTLIVNAVALLLYRKTRYGLITNR